jgi:hypothetical protein
MTNAFTNDKGSLQERVNLFNQMALPGQPLGMHMGTSYLVNDLMREIAELREALKPLADLDEQTKPMFDSIVGKEAQAHELELYVNLYAIRTARAKIEGSGS